MLQDLLTVKRRREDDAIAAVREATRTLERRRAERQAKEQELLEYNVWQETEKVRLYEQVHGKAVSRSKLEDYRERIGLLRQRQLQLEEEIAAAEREVTVAEGDLQQARQRRVDAHREVVKFEEYQAVLDEEQRLAAERKEEAETEDIVASRH